MFIIKRDVIYCVVYGSTTRSFNPWCSLATIAMFPHDERNLLRRESTATGCIALDKDLNYKLLY